MKNILYGIVATLFMTTASFGQLMSDEDHRTMINNFAGNVNTVLLTECPQGMDINQFKKKILTGEIQLSNTAKSSINSYGATVRTYGSQFASNKGITITTDAEKYILSSFAPSTAINGGFLVESTTAAGLTAEEMWTCAILNLNNDECGGTFGLIGGNKTEVKRLLTAVMNDLTIWAGNTGAAIMIGGFSECTGKYVQLEQTAFALSRSTHFDNLVNLMNDFKNRPVNQPRIDELIVKDSLTTAETTDLAVSLGFQNVQAMNDFQCNLSQNSNIIQNDYIIPNSNSSQYQKIIPNSASRYYPDQNRVRGLSFTGQQGRNLGIILSFNSCSGTGPVNTVSGWDDVVPCIFNALGLESLGVLGSYLTGGTVSMLSMEGLKSACIAWAEREGIRTAFQAGKMILGEALLLAGFWVGATVYTISFINCMATR
ncbi:MAG: hypothetical protein ACI7YS_14745 [Flavobacterium sp.]